MIGYDTNNKMLEISIDKIDEVIKAKNKGEKIIKSCETNEHLDVAKKYVDFYHRATEDLIGASQLELLLLNRRTYILSL